MSTKTETVWWFSNVFLSYYFFSFQCFFIESNQYVTDADIFMYIEAVNVIEM